MSSGSNQKSTISTLMPEFLWWYGSSLKSLFCGTSPLPYFFFPLSFQTLHDNLFAFDAKNYKNGKRCSSPPIYQVVPMPLPCFPAFGISGCQPNPHSGASVAALGVRWLAYATSQPVSRNQKPLYPPPPFYSLSNHEPFLSSGVTTSTLLSATRWWTPQRAWPPTSHRASITGATRAFRPFPVTCPAPQMTGLAPLAGLLQTASLLKSPGLHPPLRRLPREITVL